MHVVESGVGLAGTVLEIGVRWEVVASGICVIIYGIFLRLVGRWGRYALTEYIERVRAVVHFNSQIFCCCQLN